MRYYTEWRIQCNLDFKCVSVNVNGDITYVHLFADYIQYNDSYASLLLN